MVGVWIAYSDSSSYHYNYHHHHHHHRHQHHNQQRHTFGCLQGGGGQMMAQPSPQYMPQQQGLQQQVSYTGNHRQSVNGMVKCEWNSEMWMEWWNVNGDLSQECEQNGDLSLVYVNGMGI